MRSAIVRALRPLCEPADMDLLTQAVSTFEFPPPSFTEEGALLRAGALVTIHELDPGIACFHATRLLADEYTDPMSGEPAISAAAVLGAQEEMLPLYFYIMQPAADGAPEVVCECLRQLTAVPEELLPLIIGRFAATQAAALLVGLFDLLIHHKTGPHGLDYLRAFLRTTDDLDMYTYLATTLIAAGNPALRELLLDTARGTGACQNRNFDRHVDVAGGAYRDR